MTTRSSPALRLVRGGELAPTGPAGPSDEELVLRARMGDRRAEDTIYRRHAPAVLRAVDRMLGDRDESDDVVQEAFETGLARLASLRDPAALRPWLLSIALRRVHRRFRRRKLLRALGLRSRDADTELLAEQASDAATPEQRAELALVDAALARLGDDERIAWILRFVEGLELAEIAIACGCSATTIKRRLAAADAQVRHHAGRPPRTDGGGW